MVYAALSQEDRLIPIASADAGDRARINSIEIVDGKILVNRFDRFSEQPLEAMTKTYVLHTEPTLIEDLRSQH